MIRVTLILAGLLALAGAGWQMYGPATHRPPARPAATAEARQQQILEDSLGKPGDPELVRRFSTLNEKYFSGALSAMPVLWEPRLAEVGALAKRTFTLLGVFGQSGDRAVILLHPELQADAPALDRALAHEMIHAYLHAMGDSDPNHGPEFQAVLQRLLKEGAFAGVAAATPDERANLRAWIDAESVRLDAERLALDAMGPQLERERAQLEESVSALNARAQAGNAAGRGWPTPQEIAAVNAARDAYNDRAAAMNRRGTEFRLAQDQYNGQVERYNQMIAYPDGLDESSLVRPKSSSKTVR